MMKNRLLPILGTLLLVFFSSANTCCQSPDEAAIKACALNYLEGWYSADTARMAKALSPDLAKRGIIRNHQTNELRMAPASYGQMLQWVGQKPNELKSNPDIQREVYIIEVGKQIAMVKTVTPDFIDYLHLGKMDGEWKIYHAIWERPPQE